MPFTITDAHTQLQRKMLDEENEDKKPNKEFLQLLSVEVGSRWPSLAVSLSLSDGEIADLKKKTGLSKQELALQMLMTWASKEKATYGQLCHRLKTISLFQHASSS